MSRNRKARVSSDQIDEWQNIAREKLERIMDQIERTDDPDMVLEKFSGFGRDVAGDWNQIIVRNSQKK